MYRNKATNPFLVPDMSGNTYWHVKDFISDNLNDTIHFEAAHNLYIDENGIAYIFGASNPPC